MTPREVNGGDLCSPAQGRKGWRFGRFLREFRRRGLPCFVLALLATPLLAHIFLPSGSQSDNRNFAPLPTLPRSVSALVKWPREVDDYLKDHFGFRAQLIAARNAFNWRMLGESADPHVIVGRGGRLFLSDGDIRNLVVLGNCGAWWSENQRALFAAEATTALRRLRTDFPHLQVLIVPTSDLLYSPDLPKQFQQACAGKIPLVEDWLGRLPRDIRDFVAYPIETAKQMPPFAPLVPEHNFHWAGQGVSLFMEVYAEDTFHLNRQISPTWSPAILPADLERFLPELGFPIQSRSPPGLPESPSARRTIASTPTRSAISSCQGKRNGLFATATVDAYCCSATASVPARRRV